MSIARVVVRVLLSLSFLVGFLSTTAMPVAASATPKTELQMVMDVAKSKLHDPWVHYAKGPDKFDCVGFVWYSFHYNDLQSHIGGYRGVRSYYDWFKARGLVSKTEVSPGDLIIWGNFEHIGIYIGNGKAISALINPYGVTIHDVTGYIHMPVKAYLHTKLQH